MDRGAKRGVGWLGSVTLVVLALTLGTQRISTVRAGSSVANGSVQIKGKRWVNGTETSVSCKPKEGHLLRVSPGQRFLLISPGAPACSLYEDGGGVPPSPFRGFMFTGSESNVIAGGKPQRHNMFVGLETFVDDVSGTLSSDLRLDDVGGAKTDAGGIAYFRVVDGNVVIFTGHYRAKITD